MIKQKLKWIGKAELKVRGKKKCRYILVTKIVLTLLYKAKNFIF
jgi:hypothetical protein